MPTREMIHKPTFGLIVAVLLFLAFCFFLVNVYHDVIGRADVASQVELPTPAEAQPSAAIADRLPGVLEQINDYRALKDLPALRLSGMLSNSAQAKADDLVQHNYWAHYRDGKTPWDFISAAGYQYATAGENLAKCFKANSAIVPAWIASPAHEAILRGDYNDVGFGITFNPTTRCYFVVAHFGTKVVPAELPHTGVDL